MTTALAAFMFRLEPVIDVMDAVAIELQAMTWRESVAQARQRVRLDLPKGAGRQVTCAPFGSIRRGHGPGRGSHRLGSVKALFAFEDRGEHRLKGVPDDWRLFTVTSL